MKMSKRFAALLTASLLTMTPCVTVGMTAFAGATDSYTITVDGETDGYKYTAYQILKGEVTEKGEGESKELVLSDIAFSESITNPAAFVAALAASEVLTTTSGETTKPDFTEGMTALQVSDVLKGYAGNDKKLAEFARIAKANISGAGTEGDGDTIEVTGSGYYLVEESSDETKDVYSRFMMDVVGDATVKPKRDLPELTKKVTGPNANEDGTANSASIGDTVSFELNSDMPDMTGYVKYYYVINDTLAEGLTFDPASVQVFINDVKIADTQYEVQTEPEDVGDYTFQIVFKDFINRTEAKDSPIKVTYNAVLNEDADFTAAGNLNTANLTYSNNPNEDFGGTPPTGDEPEDENVVGQTPNQQTKTYTANIRINKIDNSTPAKSLAGAKFKIEGDGVKCVLINETAYEEDAEHGTFYMLKDGTFTETVPTQANKDDYDGEWGSYKKYKVVEGITTESTYTKVCKEAYVDVNGVLVFNGLGPGTYTITELEAPKGYNKLTTPIVIEITNEAPTFNTPNWAATKDGEEENIMDNDTATASFNVINNEGNTLPSTGGIGTKLFYLVGGLLAVGSGVILVTKKRMANTEK